MSVPWDNSRIHYEGARLFGRRHVPHSGFWANARRLYWIFLRGYEYEICDRCGCPVSRCVNSWWETDDALWFKINGRHEGVMCPPCFTTACAEQGISVRWRALIDDIT